MAKRRTAAQKAATLGNLKQAQAALRAKTGATAQRLSEVLTVSPALNDAPPDVSSELSRTVKAIGTVECEMEKADAELVDAEEAAERYRQRFDEALGRTREARAHKVAVKKDAVGTESDCCCAAD